MYVERSNEREGKERGDTEIHIYYLLVRTEKKYLSVETLFNYKHNNEALKVNINAHKRISYWR